METRGQETAISFESPQRLIKQIAWPDPGLTTPVSTSSIEKDLATFQNMASFRNMLVHRYETIDEELVFGLFKKRLDDFELFIRMVVKWVERQKEQT